ncbi:flagellin [Celeribacter halophilus]|uniref:flagellin N-terminal helical domain-containing protein n=1 Tax=Celeribacter halophilus TaxID=576117 RepID=UPI003A94E87D
MSSILTNNGAMVALQTLKTINSDLSKTQSMISTGKEVASAKDNSSVWAISKVMEADVAGFNAISDSLSLGESTLAVASEAAETVTDLLTDIKAKVVAAQEENVDREKIQTDIDALVGQVKSVVGAAQFNGLNLVEGTEDVNILSSLDRASNGSVAASEITINRQDLSTNLGSYGGGTAILNGNGTVSSSTVSAVANTATITVGHDAAASYTVTVGNKSVTVEAGADAGATDGAIAAAINGLGIDGVSATVTGTPGQVEMASTLAFEDVEISVSASGGSSTMSVDTNTISQRAETITFTQGTKVNDGDSYRVTFNGSAYDYIAGKGETMEDVARGLKIAIDSAGIETVSTKVTQNDAGEWQLNIDNSGADVIDLALVGEDGGTASGGLFGLDSLDVTTDFGAENALGMVETLINNSVDAAAEFGSAQGRIETQSSFISNLTDALTSGIGAMVDADMEEASAKLQALQVQQQLGVQSLSIANQSPQTILSLFG